MKNFLQNYVDKKVVVVGAGVSGVAACRLLVKNGAKVRLLDKNEMIFSQLKEHDFLGDVEMIAGTHSKDDFADADCIILSPGVPQTVYDLFPKDVFVVSELELAVTFVHEPIIAVTGTNGKTTTVSMIEHILKYCGKKVFLGGNIGTPLSEYVVSGKKADIIVLELSSFQLQNLHFFRANVGVFLNFSPNHLDYHTSLEEYLEAKMQLFAFMQAEDTAIFSEDTVKFIQKSLPCKKIIFSAFDENVGAVLQAGHNALNAGAAFCAVEPFGITKKQAAQALQSFVYAPHRYEKFLEKNGICFINDSKATTLTALQAALKSSQAPVRLLAGGIFKGGEPKMLKKYMQDKVVHIYLFGKSREIFSSAWEDICPVTWYEDLNKATKAVCKDAKSGDIVLLSPATASFDLFQNYEERGNMFKQFVNENINALK